MPLDGITAKFLYYELSEELTGARIDKIFQTDQYDIYLRLRNENVNHQLVLSANPSTARLHLTGDEITNPMTPLRFCTVLRKYLSSGRIISIETPGYERIFHIRIQTINELGDKDIKTLIIEIMGRYSNIILMNENGKIIDSALHVDDKTSRIREVLPAHIYIAPLSQNKHTLEEFFARLDPGGFSPSESEQYLEQYLLDNIVGISPAFVQEFCFQSNIDPKARLGSLDGSQIKELLVVLADYMSRIINKIISPSLFFQSADAYSPLDFHAFPLHIYPVRKAVQSISKAMDEYYSRKAKQNFLSQKKSYLVRIVNQKQAAISKKMVIHYKDLEECKNRDIYKKYGDLILSNLRLIRPGESEISVIDYYDENTPEIAIPLQPTITGSQNAQKYYKKYNKLKSKFEAVSRFLEEEKIELEYFQSVYVTLLNVDSNLDIDAVKEELLAWDINLDQKNNQADRSKNLNKKKKPNKKALPVLPRKYLSSDGYEILVGRNNLQNDLLVSKLSQKDDLWFHIQKSPGAHVVVKTNNGTPADSTIEEAAMLAAWFSKKSDASINTKVVIDYCTVKKVWKPKKSLPGHVLYRDFDSITIRTAFPDQVKEIQ